MGTELELKYQVPGRAVLEQIIAETDGVWRETSMETVYYDTAERILGARQWTLRLRQENGVPVLCCKTPARMVHGIPARGEWEWQGSDLPAGIAALVAQGAPAELAALTEGQTLEPLCAARFTRRAVQIHAGGAALELAADCGILTGDGWTQPFFELEAEHKSGDAAATASYAAALARRFGLKAEPKSKFQRALALRGCEARYVPAMPADTDAIFMLVQSSIRAVYPRYYPPQVVAFFLRLHSRAAIAADIAAGQVGALYLNGQLAGTGSFCGAHITRVYVAPSCLNQGCGSYILDRLEAEIAARAGAVQLDASLPAAHLYERRGYRTVAHRALPVDEGMILVYEVMEKTLSCV